MILTAIMIYMGAATFFWLDRGLHPWFCSGCRRAIFFELNGLVDGVTWDERDRVKAVAWAVRGYLVVYLFRCIPYGLFWPYYIVRDWTK